jgi:hypothetical protein
MLKLIGARDTTATAYKVAKIIVRDISLELAFTKPIPPNTGIY